MDGTEELQLSGRDTFRPLRVLKSLGIFGVASLIGTALFPIVYILFLLFINRFGMVGPGEFLGYILRTILKAICYFVAMGPLFLVPFLRNDALLLGQCFLGRVKTRSLAVFGLLFMAALLVMGMIYKLFVP